jgi:hypothetical protein
MLHKGGPPVVGEGFTCCFLSYSLILRKLVQCTPPEPARIAADGMFCPVVKYSRETQHRNQRK